MITKFKKEKSKVSVLGFSLIEVTVTLGIFGVCLLMITQSLENSQKSVKLIDNFSDRINTQEILYQTLHNPKFNCAEAFRDTVRYDSMNQNIELLPALTKSQVTTATIGGSSSSNQRSIIPPSLLQDSSLKIDKLIIAATLSGISARSLAPTNNIRTYTRNIQFFTSVPMGESSLNYASPITIPVNFDFEGSHLVHCSVTVSNSKIFESVCNMIDNSSSANCLQRNSTNNFSNLFPQ